MLFDFWSWNEKVLLRVTILWDCLEIGILLEEGKRLCANLIWTKEIVFILDNALNRLLNVQLDFIQRHNKLQCSTIESSVWFPAMMLNPRINLYQELLLCMMLIFWSKQIINKNEKNAKTSPKGFWASKCDVGNWIFSKSWEFNGNSMGILCWISWELSMIAYNFRSRLVSYVSKSADCLHFQNQLIVYIYKVSCFFTF